MLTTSPFSSVTDIAESFAIMPNVDKSLKLKGEINFYSGEVFGKLSFQLMRDIFSIIKIFSIVMVKICKILILYATIIN